MNIKMILITLFLLIPYSITIAQSPGEVAGYTEYDYQTNGSSGQRIAVDDLGRAHVCWYGGTDPVYTPYYNYYIPDSGWGMPYGNTIWNEKSCF